MLLTPNVYVRLAGGAQGANFVQYGGTNGFTLHTATTVNSLAASAATSLADLSSGTTTMGVGGALDMLAVRTSGDIAPFDGTSVLRINNGGLIVNGTASAAAPAISSPAPASPTARRSPRSTPACRSS